MDLFFLNMKFPQIQLGLFFLSILTNISLIFSTFSQDMAAVESMPLLGYEVSKFETVSLLFVVQK